MPAPDTSRLKVQNLNGIVHVEFVDRNILDEANIQAISDELTALVDRHVAPRILINFRNVDHLSSAALGALIAVRKRINDRGGQLRLSNIDPRIYEVFNITRLNRLFAIHPTAEDALRTFQ